MGMSNGETSKWSSSYWHLLPVLAHNEFTHSISNEFPFNAFLNRKQKVETPEKNPDFIEY